jgi:hypothetical protein
MKNFRILALLVAVSLTACGNEVEAPSVDTETVDKTAAVSSKPSFDGTVAKPGAPFSISYNIIGTPIVGSPVAIELRVSSNLGPQSVQLDYSIPDSTAMMLHAAQPASINARFAANDAWVDQRVTVIPQREGRLYLNVSASLTVEDGRSTTTIAIPLQVGQGGRVLEEEGELVTDEDGETTRVLTSE